MSRTVGAARRVGYGEIDPDTYHCLKQTLSGNSFGAAKGARADYVSRSVTYRRVRVGWLEVRRVEHRLLSHTQDPIAGHFGNRQTAYRSPDAECVQLAANNDDLFVS